MPRLSAIERLVAGNLPRYMNMKMLVRGRPRFLDPQLANGQVRFASRLGFNFSGLSPDNQVSLAQSANAGDRQVVVSNLPLWFQPGCMVRVGPSQDIGELHVILDILTSPNKTIQFGDTLISDYIVDPDNIDSFNYVSLYGTPGAFYNVAPYPSQRQTLYLEMWNQIVPGDTLLLSPTPNVIQSFREYSIKSAHLVESRPGTDAEPATVYRYIVQIASSGGLIPFVPAMGQTVWLKASPLFTRGETFANGDIALPTDVGPMLLDVYTGNLNLQSSASTIIGIKTWDASGNQTNLAAARQDWQIIPKNYVLLDRPITSDTFLFWQRVTGNFQYVKRGYFQAVLDGTGKFTMTSDILVPNWPTDRQVGWVIPVVASGPATVCVQFQPQEFQFFDIPSNQLTYIRPKIKVDPTGAPIQKIVFSISGSPSSQVEIRDWDFDGSVVESVSYYLLGSDAFGISSWLGGGFAVKPLFFNLNVLNASYSDGISRYNYGYLYS